MERRNKPFDRMIDGNLLQDALSEDPPPPLSELARRLRHSREFLRQKFPELSTAIVARYIQYQKVLTEKRTNAGLASIYDWNHPFARSANWKHQASESIVYDTSWGCPRMKRINLKAKLSNFLMY